jgi:large subunit ribosomal protein L5
MSEFYQKYVKEIRPHLQKELGLSNINAVPHLTSIVINMGVGAAKDDKKILDHAVADLEKIAGQKPIITKAHKSIAGFKIREDWPIGCKVTLRGKRMYDFLQRLVQIAATRIPDFRGFKTTSFDGRGNYSLGLKEQIVFTEIDYDKIDRIRGMDVTITTNSPNDEYAAALLKAFGFPFKNGT